MSGRLADLDAEQLRLINRARSFVETRFARGYDVALDPECYLTSWARTLGHARLRRLAFGWRAEPARLLAGLRDCALGVCFCDMSVTDLDQYVRAFEHLIVSWALPGDFDVNGAYADRYFGIKSSDAEQVLWIVVLLNGTPPATLPRNVRVLRPSRARWRLRVPSRSGRRARRCSRAVRDASSIADAVARVLRGGRFRSVVMPYEGQPFQHAVNVAAKNQGGIATVGYMHSALPALPTDFLFREGAPDRLLLNGPGQCEILTNHLGWPAERVRAIPSLRYRRDRYAPLDGKILLPYGLYDAESIARAFESFLRSAGPGTLPRWEVRHHPVMASSPRHLTLAAKLEELVGRYADRICVGQTAKPQAVIIGATAAVLEALERGVDVVHVCADPLFEAHSPSVWTHLEVQALADNVYRYALVRSGAYIELSTSSDVAMKLLGLDR